jgi:3'-phosphoadenosine 5'-phosphosulfate sulfotransferase (PAPS reductase)/FAD synthetase
MTPLLKLGLPGRTDRGVAVTDEVTALLDAGAPVAIGVSGGKDSCAAAIATNQHLYEIGHTGDRVLIHSDLGRVEWKDSLPTCERLAKDLGLELIVVRRAAGDMMDRWLVRWANNVERYADLSCVKVILPWSTPSMRFCTSELKTAVMCRALIKRFPGAAILSASGVRRDESPKRKNKPIAAWQAKLSSARYETRGMDWNPIAEWSAPDVFAYIRERGFALHEAYTRYELTRVSCAFCIMSSEHDLVASATCPDNTAIYREMVDLEIESTFAFQGDRWLGDVAPHLLTEDQRLGLVHAKDAARIRERLEAQIPEHLLYEDGWPKITPTRDEAEMLAGIRAEMGLVLGFTVSCTTADAVLARYAELMEENARRKEKKGR